MSTLALPSISIFCLISFLLRSLARLAARLAGPGRRWLGRPGCRCHRCCRYCGNLFIAVVVFILYIILYVIQYVIFLSHSLFLYYVHHWWWGWWVVVGLMRLVGGGG